MGYVKKKAEEAADNPFRTAANIGTFGTYGYAEDAAKGPLKGLEGAWNDISGKSGADAAAEAARLQAAGGDKALAENMRQFNIGQENLAPWLKAGKGALDEQQSLMGLNGDSAGAMRTLQNSPGYQFRLSQGQKSLDAGLAARGGMGSGKSLVAGNIFNQDNASSEYGNRLNQLAGLSGTGQSTAGQLGQLGANYATNQGNIYTGVANAQGAAGIAGANSRQSGLLGVLNLAANGAGSYYGEQGKKTA